MINIYGDFMNNTIEILDKISNTEMSMVYVGKNKKTDEKFIVKKKLADYDSKKVLEIYKKLDHPALPKVINHFINNGIYYEVLEYIDGISLKEKLDKEGRQKEEEVVCWALQLCNVFLYLHAQNPKIIYRDLKPGNIMLDKDNKIYLIDFGTIREYEKSKNHDTIRLGTIGYAAPEQYDKNAQTDEKTDIYTFGITLYYLLTNKSPCDKPYKIYPIRHWYKDLSDELERIIIKCTEKDPNKRYKNFQEVKFELENYRDPIL